jgi:hypothetical protein
LKGEDDAMVFFRVAADDDRGELFVERGRYTH